MPLGLFTLAKSGGLLVNPVYTGSSVVEHGGALGSRIAFGKAFESVVHDIIGVRYLVDREVAFEHASVGAELLDTIMHQGRQSLGQLFRADGLCTCMPVKAEAALSDPAELDDDVGTCCHGRNAPPPCGQHFVVPVGIRTDPYQATDMVQDDGEI